jgi:hypothetical protein
MKAPDDGGRFVVYIGGPMFHQRGSRSTIDAGLRQHEGVALVQAHMKAGVGSNI